MVRKIIILAGAPDSNKLDWNTPGLLDQFLKPLAEFAGLEKIHDPETLQIDSHSAEAYRHGSDMFFNPLPPSEASLAGSLEDELSQDILTRFYDHSLAVHDDMPSSYLPNPSLSTQGGSSLDTTTGLDSFEKVTQVQNSVSEGHRHPLVDPAHLSDLEDVPSPSHLLDISPQTMSVNLIVGIISIAEPRTVRTRWGATRSLVELLVGDESKSGFSITFWLSPDSREASDAIIRSLRRQDIVLLRNVALGVFMKKVHGHSLRKGLTKVDLLHRRKLYRDDKQAIYTMRDVSSTKPAHPQLLKTRQVRNWVLQFVGGGGTSLGKRKHKGQVVRDWEMPPEDTQ